MQIGDVVVIKPDLSLSDDFDGSPGLEPDMLQYRGQTMTVRDFGDYESDDEHWFFVEENSWVWHTKWTEDNPSMNEIQEIKDEELEALLSGD